MCYDILTQVFNNSYTYEMLMKANPYEMPMKGFIFRACNNLKI